MTSTPIKMLNGPPTGLPPISLPPSPPSSAGRTSGENTAASSLQSTPTPANKSLNQPQQIHLQEHHRVFRAMLGLSTAQRDDTPHTRAREKLLLLSPIQFLELSTDVYDELLRREDERYAVPGVPVNLLPEPTFHPKRNQARQKLAALAEKRFKELAGDVLYESERRVPRFVNLPFEAVDFSRGKASTGAARPPKVRPNMNINTSIPMRTFAGRRPSVTSPYSPGIFDVTPGFPSPSPTSNDFGRPLPKQYQNRSVSDNSSRMRNGQSGGYATRREFDAELGRSATRSSNGTSRSRSRSMRDKDNGIEYQAQIEELNRKLVSLEGRLTDKDGELRASQNDASESQRVLEAERAKSTAIVNNLESQLASATTLTTSLRAEITTLKATNAAHPADTTDWRTRYEALHTDFTSQRRVTDAVRAEALASLSELKSLSARCTSACAAEDALARQVSTLQSSLSDWKARYAALSAGRPAPPAHALPQPDVRDAAYDRADGRIPAEALAAFQLAVDELLCLLRTGRPGDALEYMSTMVARVRAVTQPACGGGEAEERAKSRVAVAANGLITAASAHADAHGLLPVGLVDAAAAGLSGAVVELCRASGVRRAEPLAGMEPLPLAMIASALSAEPPTE